MIINCFRASNLVIFNAWNYSWIAIIYHRDDDDLKTLSNECFSSLQISKLWIPSRERRRASPRTTRVWIDVNKYLPNYLGVLFPWLFRSFIYIVICCDESQVQEIRRVLVADKHSMQLENCSGGFYNFFYIGWLGSPLLSRIFGCFPTTDMQTLPPQKWSSWLC